MEEWIIKIKKISKIKKSKEKPLGFLGSLWFGDKGLDLFMGVCYIIGQTKEGRGLMKAPKIVFIAIICVMMATTMATAATISFASGDGSATSNTGNVFVIPPHPVWGSIPGASWVSAYAGTGYGGGNVLPNWVAGAPTMVFTQTFLLAEVSNKGWVTVGADDTAGVRINGTLIKAPNFVPDSACSAGPIACEQAEFMTLDLTPWLVQGMNTLLIEEYQLGGDVAGAIWKGTAESVPEPGTYALMAAGLGAFAFIRHRRQRKA